MAGGKPKEIAPANSKIEIKTNTRGQMPPINAPQVAEAPVIDNTKDIWTEEEVQLASEDVHDDRI